MISSPFLNVLSISQLNQRSLSLSSRCQLFDQFQDRMSQHAVKVDFLRRVHRQNAPNRRTSHQHNKRTIKVDLQPRQESVNSSHLKRFQINSLYFLTITVWIQVPDAIKSQYRNPPTTLLPAGVRQLELVCSPVPEHQPSKHLTSQAEQKEVGRKSFYG